MKYNPAIHHRRSIRLKGYDYSRPGAYFITICTQDRLNLFGKIKDHAMILNDPGQMVQSTWETLAQRFPYIDLDEFIIMTNHVHGIIVINENPGEWGMNAERGVNNGPNDNIGDHDGQRGDHKDRPSVDANPCGAKIYDNQYKTIQPKIQPKTTIRKGESRIRPLDPIHTPDPPHPNGTKDGSLGRIIQAFKSLTTYHYTIGVRQNGWEPFPGKLWQRDYYEHIIRNERELTVIRNYIRNNPFHEDDKLKN